MPGPGSPAPNVDLRQIRRHGTTQEAGFEELCFQLVPTLDALPTAARLTRHKAPDGGVEFSWQGPGGAGRWAWQSKYLFGLDASAYAQMDESFQAAIKNFPDITRYCFILPTNRTGAAPRAGAPSGLTRWSTQTAAWKADVLAKGISLDVEYIGESEIVAALLRSEHSGRLRYFFDQTFLDTASLVAQVGRAVANLGPRYRPEVNVDLEIREVIEATAKSDEWRRNVDEARRKVRRYGLRDVARSAAAAPVSLGTVIDQAAAADDTLVANFDALCDPTSDAVSASRSALGTAIRSCEAATEGVTRELERLRNAGDPPKATDTPDRSTMNVLYSAEREIWETDRQLREIDELLGSESATAAVLLLDGEAGAGKSHLLADVARARIARGAPTFLLLGQDFVERDLWAQVAEMTGLNLDADELLKSLSAAAQVAGRGRFLLLIDAVNERHGMRVWPSRLAGFLADLRRYPWVAAVLSVRSTYATDVLGSVTMPRATHPGLDGHEEEALATYAAHYGLRLADLPPLLSEAANPLFLGSLCRVLSAAPEKAVPRTGAGASWVFEGLLDTVEVELAKPHRLDFPTARNPVRSAIAGIASAMLAQDNDALEWSRAEGICEGALPSRGGYTLSLLHGLLTEGLLLEESAAGATVVRFSYQRLGDHLMAQELIRQHADARGVATEIARITSARLLWNLKGLLDALAILVPEQLGIELVDLLWPPRRPRSRSSRAGTSLPSRRLLMQLLVEGLHWRSGASITPRTIELAQQAVATGYVDNDDWVDLHVRLATVPAHPMNADRTAAVLGGLPMWRRDLAWSAPLLGQWGDPTSVTRTLRWALLHGSDASDEVAELAGRLLIWLLTIPNARTRDRSTKALVALHEHRPRSLADLLHSAAAQDDPYLLERVAAACLGWVLRHRTDPDPDLAGWTALRDAGEAVVTSRETTHILIRSYISSIVEHAGMVIAASTPLVNAQGTAKWPPSPWPLRPPTRRSLERRFGDETKSYILREWDDFYRYTIEGTLRYFIPTDQDTLRARRRRKLVADRHVAVRLEAEALSALTQAERDQLLQWLGEGKLREAESKFPEWRAASEGLARVVWLLRELDRLPMRVDAESVALLASGRVLSAGWTNDRFGAIDRGLRRGRGGRDSKIERFGKKYQRIGFLEVLGQLADHCRIGEDFDQSPPEPYRGLWQVGYVQDIDPSVVMPPKALQNADSPPWWHTAFSHQLDAAGSDSDWSRSMADAPVVREHLLARDDNGDDWLVLDSQTEWTHVFDRPRHGMSEDRREMWFSTYAYVVDATALPRVASWGRRRNWIGDWMPTDRYGSGLGFMGAYPDLEPWADLLAGREGQVARRGLSWRKVDGLAPLLGLTVAAYSFSSERDASFDSGGATCQLPSPLLLEILNARWTPASSQARNLGLGPAEAERSWSSPTHVVAFWAEAPSGRGHALFVRAAPLRDALNAKNLAMWTTLLGEKIYWTVGNPSHERLDIFGAASLGPLGWHVHGLHGEHRRSAREPVTGLGPVQSSA